MRPGSPSAMFGLLPSKWRPWAMAARVGDRWPRWRDRTSTGGIYPHLGLRAVAQSRRGTGLPRITRRLRPALHPANLPPDQNIEETALFGRRFGLVVDVGPRARDGDRRGSPWWPRRGQGNEFRHLVDGVAREVVVGCERGRRVGARPRRAGSG